MSRNDIFNTAATGMTLLYSYSNFVAEEIGNERAMDLWTEMFEAMGAKRGKIIREQTGSGKFDALAAWLPIKALKDDIGQDYEVTEETPQRVVVRIDKCPFYQAAQILGMDASAIEMRCLGGPMRTADTMLKQLNSNLHVSVQKFRSTPDDFCEEEISLR